ncbi:phosphotransferase family protein [Streptomyces sp. AC495_CC817]|uniref:phosphotransferase family protein n=1 Tax=Streptomyces sp. AC495_CC817 TaxID=2823900 RepID=UPI001C255926|nr:aminoglycoside phosphotransferase family protein [Streptomyces sp. AC495_CC817]
MPSHTHDVTLDGAEVRKRFVNWADGEADREWRCLRLLHDEAPGIAPRPLRRETVDGHPVVVMERLPGESLGGAPLTAEQTLALGATLRTLYGIPRERVVAAGIEERRYGPSTLPAALAGWLDDIPDLSACRDPERVRAGIAAAREWLARPGGIREPRLDSLGIADLNPANILWDGRTCRLVDFEDGGLTDAAFDLADHVEHIAARLPGVFDVDALCAAVELSTDDEARMRAYRPLWAAFWLVMLLPGNGGFRRNPPGTTEAQAEHLMALIG